MNRQLVKETVINKQTLLFCSNVYVFGRSIEVYCDISVIAQRGGTFRWLDRLNILRPQNRAYHRREAGVGEVGLGVSWKIVGLFRYTSVSGVYCFLEVNLTVLVWRILIMFTASKVLLIVCIAFLVTSCSETTNDLKADTDILFARLNHDEQMDQRVLGFWSIDYSPGLDSPGLFFFNEGDWIDNATPNMELLIVEFLEGNKWQASLLYHDWNDDYHLHYPYLIGEYMFKDNGQFMMSGGRFGCFSSVTGLYYVKGDRMVLRANGSHIGLDRYSPRADPRVRDRQRVKR